MSNKKLSFYVDTLIVEAAISDHTLVKHAQEGVSSGFVEAIKNYVGAHIDPENPVKSILTIIAPGTLFLLFRSSGFPKIGWLMALASSVFRVNISGMLEAIYDQIKGVISGGGKLSSDQVDGIVNQSISANTPPTTVDHVKDFLQKLISGNFSLSDYFSSASADDGLFSENSFESQMRAARRTKLAIIHFESSLSKISNLESYAAPQKDSLLSKALEFINPFSNKKAETNSILARVLSYFFKVALAAAGFMVIGDVINAAIGRSSALTGTLQGGKPVPGSGKTDDPSRNEQVPGTSRTPASKPSASKQSKFPIKSNYIEESLNTSKSASWKEYYTSNQYSIENMVLDFANDVYAGLEDKESIIRSSPGFKSVVERIVFHNRDNIGHNIVFIPDIYHSKKEIVDTFIEDVARKS